MRNILLVKYPQAEIDVLSQEEAFPHESKSGTATKGKDDATTIGKNLALLRLGAIKLVCGPALRCSIPAELIGKELGVEPQVIEALADRNVVLDNEEITIGEFRARQERGFLDPYALPGCGGESSAQHRVRVEAWLVDQLANNESDTLVVVTHGATLEHLHSVLSAKPAIAMAHTFSFCAPGSAHIWRAIELPDQRKIWCSVSTNVSLLDGEEMDKKYNICSLLGMLEIQLATDDRFSGIKVDLDSAKLVKDVYYIR